MQSARDRLQRAEEYSSGANNLRAEDAQQAAELALKAVVVASDRTPRRTHDIDALLAQIREVEKDVPDSVRAASRLSKFGGTERYELIGGHEPQPSDDETRQAVKTARATVDWSEERVRERLTPAADRSIEPAARPATAQGAAEAAAAGRTPGDEGRER